MISAFAWSGHAIAAAAFLLLAALLVPSARKRRARMFLVASVASAAWAGIIGAQIAGFQITGVVLYYAETLRATAWLLAICSVAGSAAPRLLIWGVRGFCVLMFLVPLVVVAVETLSHWQPDLQIIFIRCGLISALLAVVLLEQIYRNTPQAARGGLILFAAGVGIMAACDLFLYSQAELLHGLPAAAWLVRGYVHAAAVPVLALAVRRNDWALDIFVSRHVVFYTSTFIAIGVYLLLMAAGGYYVRRVGGTWGGWMQIAFFIGAGIVLTVVLSSSMLRRRLQVFISKHFYRNKYDYRIEWLRFIETLASADEENVCRTATRAVAQIFDSPGGLLFTRDEQGRYFVPAAAWPMNEYSVEGVGAIAADHEMVRFLERRQWIIDLREYERMPDRYENIQLPAFLREKPDLRLVSPVLNATGMLGFFVLYEPRTSFELTYEDRDLLKTVGRHVATHIEQYTAARKLAEGRQFEAYNRLTAFMMHDLKNAVAQLQLVVTNAARHSHKPEFVQDAIGTIDNAVGRMTRLIEQLNSAGSPLRLQTVRLDQIVENAVKRSSARKPVPQLESVQPATVKADGDRLTTVIEHVIRNAQDAAQGTDTIKVRLQVAGDNATVSVEDRGIGMSPEFVRDRLFRPFDSTKGSKGMGIGAYQVREYVQMLGGYVEVQSTPGFGTCFSITLPLSTSEDPASGSAAMAATA